MGKTFWNAVVYAGVIMGAFGVGRFIGKLDVMREFIRRTDEDREHDRIVVHTLGGTMTLENDDKGYFIKPETNFKI